MADLIMLGGGTGTQVGTDYPGIVGETEWEDNNPSDFMDTNGEALLTGDYDLTYVDANSSTLGGDFSTITAGTYVMISAGLTSTNHGYFKISSITSNTLCTIANTNLNGDDIAAGDDTNTVTVSIGGAAHVAGVDPDDTVIENCNDTIGSFIDLTVAGHNTDVLYNISETASANIIIDTASTVSSAIRYIGRKIDFSDCESESDYPVFTLVVYKFTIPPVSQYFKHLKFTGTRDSNNIGIVYAYGKKTVFEECSFTLSNTHGDCCIASSYGILINCNITSNGTGVTGAVRLFTSQIHGCIITSTNNDGIYSSMSNIKSCIIIGGGTAKGIHLVTGGSLLSINNTTIYNFDYCIYVTQMPLISSSSSTVYNNILVGSGAGAYGIYNNDTEDTTMCIWNNFIYNCLGGEDNFNHDIRSVSLSAYPFATNPPTTAKHFYLNDEATGGVLVKGKMLPMDFDLDGIQDNYSAGAIMAEASASGGGSVNRLEGLLS